MPLYRLCDVALITPLARRHEPGGQGIHGVAPDQTGVLILSEMAGAAKEMGEALIINPFHREDFAKALEQALTMPVEEQIRRNKLMQERLRRYDVVRWADDFVQALLSTQKTEAARRARVLAGKALGELMQQYRSTTRRALAAGLRRHAGAVCRRAEPGAAGRGTAGVAHGLGSDPANEVAIVSGRPRHTLEEWFGQLPISLIAEHGVWLRQEKLRLAHVENHDQRLEGARAADSPAFRGPPAGRAAGGKGIFARPGITAAPTRTRLRSRQGTARRPDGFHAEH